MPTTQTRKSQKKKTGKDGDVNVPPPSAAPVFVLPEALTIENVAEVAAGIRALQPGKGMVLTIDAAQTDIITTPGVQLLLSLSSAMQGQGGKLLIVRPRESFVLACNALGVASQLAMGGA